MRPGAGDLLSHVPARSGHFLLESGYHSELWLTLDDLFCDPEAIAPLIETLAERLRPHRPSVVCGPLLGGAFLAQAVATAMGARFCYTEPADSGGDGELYAARYRLPVALIPHVRGRTVAVVDDVISAGSSVRATVAALDAAGASIVAVGALMTLGDRAMGYFADEGIPVETLDRRAFELWAPDRCPLCNAHIPLEDPRTADA